MQADVPHDVGRTVEHIDRRAVGALTADRADSAGMGVDQAGADRHARQEAQRERCLRGQARTERGARFGDFAADPPAVVGEQVGEADPFEVLRAPAPLVGEIGPLACHRARRPSRASRRAIGQIVGKVEKVPGRVIRRRQRLLQPQQLRRLHFGRDDAADMAQHRIAGLGDAPGLADRAMIHPDDDVALRIARQADAEGLPRPVDHRERTGRVEADTLDERPAARPLPPARRGPHLRRPARCPRRIVRRCRLPRATGRSAGVPSKAACLRRRTAPRAHSWCRRRHR
jgi:hypothetical protein